MCQCVCAGVLFFLLLGADGSERRLPLGMRVCLPDVLSRLKAIRTSDLSGDTLRVEVIIYAFTRPQAQNRAVSMMKKFLMKGD